jgi:hypothetical protein
LTNSASFTQPINVVLQFGNYGSKVADLIRQGAVDDASEDRDDGREAAD